MSKVEIINYEELEELSAVGGADSYAMAGANSDVLVSGLVFTTYELAQLTIAATTVSIAWSALFSCTKNKVTCKRKK